MDRLKSVSLFFSFAFLLGTSNSFAQVPDKQSQTNKQKAELRTAQIESARSDIDDLSKFEFNHEYLPKSIYKRDYVDKRKAVPVIAGQAKPDYGVGHRY